MEKKKIIAVCMLATFGIFAAYGFANLNNSPAGGNSDTVGQLKGTIHVVAKHADGEVFYDKVYYNNVTNWGRNMTRNALTMVGAPAAGIKSFLNITNITLSNGTTAVTGAETTCEATLLITNGIFPAQAVMAENYAMTVGNQSAAFTWTASGMQGAISKVCLMNQTGTNPFASAILSPYVNLASGDQLTVTYFVAIY